MVAIKNQARAGGIFCIVVALALAGCTPPGPRALLDGRRLLERGQTDKAIIRLKTAASLLPGNAQAWNYLGLAYHRTGDFANATSAYRTAITLDRNLLEARFNLGCLYQEQNQLEAAKTEFTAYTLRRGNEVGGWLKLGTVQLRLRELTAAEQSFRQAQRVNPKEVEAFNGLGLVQVQRGRPAEAAQFFYAALKLQPDYGPALLNQATILNQNFKDTAGAIKIYRAYLALQPAPPNAEAVKAVVRSLEAAVAVQSLPATNAPVRAVTPPMEIAKVTRQTSAPPVRVEIPRPQPQPEPPATPKPESPPVITKTPAPVQPARTSAVEVVTLPPEPVIKTPVDEPPIVPARPPMVTKVNEEKIEGTNAPAPAPISAETDKQEKPGFFSRLNPLNLFRHDEKSETQTTPLPQSTVVLPAEQGDESANSTPENDSGVTNAVPPAQVTQAAPEPPVAITRYQYLSPAKPVAGDRREAERAFAQGQQAQRANRVVEAIQAYRQATVSDPAYFEAYYNLGLAAYEARSFRQALAAWETALALQPDSTDTRYNFALALKAANYPADAAKELEKILATTPNDTRAHLVLGNLYAEQLGSPSRARTQYLKVLELDPRHPQATAIRYWLVAHSP